MTTPTDTLQAFDKLLLQLNKCKDEGVIPEIESVSDDIRKAKKAFEDWVW